MNVAIRYMTTSDEKDDWILLVQEDENKVDDFSDDSDSVRTRDTRETISSSSNSVTSDDILALKILDESYTYNNSVSMLQTDNDKRDICNLRYNCREYIIILLFCNFLLFLFFIFMNTGGDL